MRSTANSRNLRQRQRGLSLLFSLLSLVAMSIATLALVRSVDTSAMLLGNIGLKQDATAAADQATRLAIDWLSSNLGGLTADNPGTGYYASTQELAGDGATVKPPVDVTGEMIVSGASNARQLVDWDGDSCATAPSGTYTGCSIHTASAGNINGNKARYVVFRLCSKPGDFMVDTTVSCAQRPANAECGGPNGGLKYGGVALGCAKAIAYYRVVVRVQGARDTTSFTETIVHF
jgi:type IV pilus assembly protein PilX